MINNNSRHKFHISSQYNHKKKLEFQINYFFQHNKLFLDLYEKKVPLFY